MKIKKTMAAVLAASLVATPVVAQAAAADGARTGSPVGEGEEISGGWFLPALAIIAVILGLVVLIDDGEDLPTSP